MSLVIQEEVDATLHVDLIPELKEDPNLKFEGLIEYKRYIMYMIYEELKARAPRFMENMQRFCNIKKQNPITETEFIKGLDHRILQAQIEHYIASVLESPMRCQKYALMMRRFNEEIEYLTENRQEFTQILKSIKNRANKLSTTFQRVIVPMAPLTLTQRTHSEIVRYSELVIFHLKQILKTENNAEFRRIKSLVPKVEITKQDASILDLVKADALQCYYHDINIDQLLLSYYKLKSKPVDSTCEDELLKSLMIF